MAPYRNSRTGARSTRTQIDHDVFEGLPVRHWRKRSFNVSTAPDKDNLDLLSTGDTGWPELPMPRDAHMYSPMSEALLRAARMGQVKKPVTPLLDDEKEPGEDEDGDGDLDIGFVAKRWAVVPKDMEGPEPEFLAKRRKGLPSVYSGATGPFGTTQQMRKTKIRKVDTEGNSYIWEVLVPEGQAVDGEIVEEEASPTQAPAPGTVVEGLGVVNAEGVVIAGEQAMPAVNRRRPPPPKRKAKGPGRGRKKKVAFTPGTEGASVANGVGAVFNGSIARIDDGENPKRELGVPDGDTEMGDENVLQDGEEGSEEGSEGDEGEDGEREEGELSPSPTPAKSPMEPPIITVNDIKVESAKTTHDATLAPSKLPLSLPAEPTREEISDPMLLDEDDGLLNRSFSNPTVPSIAQSTESTIDLTAAVAAEESKGATPTDEPIPKSSEAVVEVPNAALVAEPPTEAQLELLATPPPDTTLQSKPQDLARLAVEDIMEPLAEQPPENPAEPLTKPGIELRLDEPPKHMIDIADSTVKVVAEQTLGVFTDITKEVVPEPKTDSLEAGLTESIPPSSTGAAPQPATYTELPLTTELMSVPELEVEFPYEPPMSSTTVLVEGPEPVTVQTVDEQPLAELPVMEQPLTEQPIMQQPVLEQPVLEQPVLEQPVLEQPVLEQPDLEQPIMQQPVIEQPVIEQPMSDQPMSDQSMSDQPMSDQPMSEHPVTEQRVSEQSMTEQPMSEHPVTEQRVSEQSMTEQTITEPTRTETWARQATEPFPESTSPERRFSYTRVTTSPQAPTPSPPTPIENKFGLKAPYLSPKAPTMSPPTPIERSMSSSPDIPLADQHFRLPPQIDAAQEADQTQTPDMLPNPGDDCTSTKTAPSVDSRVNPPIVVKHDALAGMANPSNAEESEGSTQHFTDGEEDLLGSLERSLGKQGGRS